MRLLLAAFIAAAAFSGCAVYTPSGAVVVGDPGRPQPAGAGGGTFCPPGQAKKGNC